MAADLLEVEHHVRQVFIFNLLSLSLVGDGPVLAEDTAEIAVGEEDGPRPISAHQRHLLAKMRVSPENYGFYRGPAKSPFALSAIYPTPAGTELAILEDRVCLLDLLGKFALLFQFLIRWTPPFSLLCGIKGSGIEKQRAAQEKSTFNKIPTGSFHTLHSPRSEARRPFFS